MHGQIKIGVVTIQFRKFVRQFNFKNLVVKKKLKILQVL